MRKRHPRGWTVPWAALAVCGVLAGAVPASAGAQVSRPFAQRLEGRLDQPTFAAVVAIVDSAERNGLPTEPLVDKALEGASKRAPGPRIVTALRTLVGELAVARLALGGSAAEPEIVAAAGALHIGVRPADLTRLRQARGRQDLTVPLGVLSDLVARGVPTDTATTAVLALAEARIDDEELVEFRRSVERDIALGAPPGAAVRVGMTTDAFTESLGGVERASAPPTRPRRP